MNNLRDTFTRKGFFAEPALDVVQHLCVRHVVLVQHVFELQVCRPKTIAEVLCEDPATICALWVNFYDAWSKNHAQAYVAS